MDYLSNTVQNNKAYANKHFFILNRACFLK